MKPIPEPLNAILRKRYLEEAVVVAKPSYTAKKEEEEIPQQTPSTEYLPRYYSSEPLSKINFSDIFKGKQGPPPPPPSAPQTTPPPQPPPTSPEPTSGDRIRETLKRLADTKAQEAEGISTRGRGRTGREGGREPKPSEPTPSPRTPSDRPGGSSTPPGARRFPDPGGESSGGGPPSEPPSGPRPGPGMRGYVDPTEVAGEGVPLRGDLSVRITHDVPPVETKVPSFFERAGKSPVSRGLVSAATSKPASFVATTALGAYPAIKTYELLQTLSDSPYSTSPYTKHIVPPVGALVAGEFSAEMAKAAIARAVPAFLKGKGVSEITRQGLKGLPAGAARAVRTLKDPRVYGLAIAADFMIPPVWNYFASGEASKDIEGGARGIADKIGLDAMYGMAGDPMGLSSPAYERMRTAALLGDQEELEKIAAEQRQKRDEEKMKAMRDRADAEYKKTMDQFAEDDDKIEIMTPFERAMQEISPKKKKQK
jgi:hypothetical protein